MRYQWFEMVYKDNRRCWAFIEGDYNYTLFCGDSFLLRTSKDQGVSCRLELSGIQWYIVMGSENIKLNLRENETYIISK